MRMTISRYVAREASTKFKSRLKNSTLLLLALFMWREGLQSPSRQHCADLWYQMKVVIRVTANCSATTLSNVVYLGDQSCLGRSDAHRTVTCAVAWYSGVRSVHDKLHTLVC